MDHENNCYVEGLNKSDLKEKTRRVSFIGINKVIGPGIQIMETGIIEWAKIKRQKSKKKFKIDKKIKVFKHQGKIVHPYAQAY